MHIPVITFLSSAEYCSNEIQLSQVLCRGSRCEGRLHGGHGAASEGVASAGTANVGGFLGVLASARGLGDLSADVVGGIMQFLP